MGNNSTLVDPLYYYDDELFPSESDDSATSNYEETTDSSTMTNTKVKGKLSLDVEH